VSDIIAGPPLVTLVCKEPSVRAGLAEPPDDVAVRQILRVPVFISVDVGVPLALSRVPLSPSGKHTHTHTHKHTQLCMHSSNMHVIFHVNS